MTDPSPDELPADPRDALIREQTERLGEQERRLAETRLFVLPSTSPANAAVPWKERLRWFRALAKASA